MRLLKPLIQPHARDGVSTGCRADETISYNRRKSAGLQTELANEEDSGSATLVQNLVMIPLADRLRKESLSAGDRKTLANLRAFLHQKLRDQRTGGQEYSHQPEQRTVPKSLHNMAGGANRERPGKRTGHYI